MLNGKKIVIGITGSIAAYKIPFLVRLLKKEGAEVQVMMTPAAKDFTTPLTLSTLSEKPVLSAFFDEKDGSWTSHVDLGLWADMMIIAPLSANTMAKMATGVADNFMLTTILSARCPVYFAPAMDLDMYNHPTTQENIIKLQSFGYRLIEPAEGELASGLKGMGRLEEPEKIVTIIKDDLAEASAFQDKKVLISAGPTYESIDPVRFIGNHSSGKMGTEIALAMANAGAKVHLVLGPSSIDIKHPGVRITSVTSASEMYEACVSDFQTSDIAIMSAAVADFTPVSVQKEKIKKENKPEKIDLKPTKDILAELGKMKSPKQLLVGFALETENAIAHAEKKLKNKNLDLIVVNTLQDKGAGFGVDTNKITVISKTGEQKEFPLKSKKEVALDILNVISSNLE